MAINNRTANRDYPLPHEDNKMRSEDLPRLIAALDAIDADVAAILATLAGKSDTGHGHAIDAITGLTAALAGKSDTGHTHELGSLTGINLTGAANGQFLKRVSGIWVPASIAANDIVSGTIAEARLPSWLTESALAGKFGGASLPSYPSASATDVSGLQSGAWSVGGTVSDRPNSTSGTLHYWRRGSDADQTGEALYIDTSGRLSIGVVDSSGAVTWQTLQSASVDYQSFTSSGTWTKPEGFSADALVLVHMWGGGGGGHSNSNGAGGGGGGFNRLEMRLGALPSSVSVTVGAGGAVGGAGGNTAFGSYGTAYGGGAGGGEAGPGGGGGGALGAGANGGAGGAGGGPLGGATAGAGNNGNDSIMGGGSGGGGGSGVNTAGGSSFYGGGGGAGGRTGGNPNAPGGDSFWGGGGGSSNGSGAGGTSRMGGNGGANNIAGTAPAGGGGRGAAGARGEVRVWVIG